MSYPVRFSRTIQGELPFTLNLPDETYQVSGGGTLYPLQVLQNRLAVADSPRSMQVGTEAEIRPALADRWDELYMRELRTIVRHDEEVIILHDQLPAPTEQQLFEAAKSFVLRSTDVPVAGPDQLQEDACRWMDTLSENDRARFVIDASIRLAAETLFASDAVKLFCKAVNTLIRLFMATFDDFFAQEVTEQSFSDTAFRGIYEALFCDGQQVEHTRHVGGLFPFIIRQPWFQHPAEAIERFRAQLHTNPEPDPVKLLMVRGRGFFIRGGFRSAVIEASAAFDLCLIRKIRQGFLVQGKTDADIDAVLKQNPRLEDRAKKVLKDAVGQSAADLDPPLWENFVAHRRQRGSVAHSAAEPTEAEAKEAVEEIVRLAQLVDALA